MLIVNQENNYFYYNGKKLSKEQTYRKLFSVYYMELDRELLEHARFRSNQTKIQGSKNYE